MILVDTHVVLWLALEPERVSKNLAAVAGTVAVLALNVVLLLQTVGFSF